MTTEEKLSSDIYIQTAQMNAMRDLKDSRQAMVRALDMMANPPGFIERGLNSVPRPMARLMAIGVHNTRHILNFIEKGASRNPMIALPLSIGIKGLKKIL